MRRGWEKNPQVRVSGPMTDRIGNPKAPRSGTPTRLTSHPARAARRGNPKRYLPGRVPMFRSAGARFRRSEIDLREKRSVGTPRLGPPVSICHFRSDQQGSFSARAPNRGPKRLNVRDNYTSVYFMFVLFFNSGASVVRCLHTAVDG